MEKIQRLNSKIFTQVNTSEMSKIYGGKRVRTGPNSAMYSTGDIQKYRAGELIWTKYLY